MEQNEMTESNAKQDLYQVVNFRTGQLIGKPKTARAARKLCDRKDREYGAICTNKVRVEG